MQNKVKRDTSGIGWRGLRGPFRFDLIGPVMTVRQTNPPGQRSSQARGTSRSSGRRPSAESHRPCCLRRASTWRVCLPNRHHRANKVKSESYFTLISRYRYRDTRRISQKVCKGTLKNNVPRCTDPSHLVELLVGLLESLEWR